MKHILGLVIMTFSLSAYAQHQHIPRHNHYYHYHSHSNNDWLFPAVVGGMIVYGITRQYEQNRAPVIVEQYPLPQQTNCTEWREVYRNGVRYLERTCFNR